jgi:maltose-binding protein MalE
MKKLMVLVAMLAMTLIVAAPAIARIDQESEQEAESGEVDQSFEVSSSGDNSNQCAGIQGVANTGNAQNQIDFVEFFSLADDFEFDEVGSDVDISPENSTECDQQVNQAASASG